MNINVTKTHPVSFFVPVGIGVLAQMFCAGLLMAITAIGFTTPGQRNAIEQSSGPTALTNPNPEGAVTDSSSIRKTEPLSAAASDPAVGAETNADAPVNPGSTDPAGKLPTEPSSAPSVVPGPPGDTPAADRPVVTGQPLDDVRNRSRKLPIAGEGISDEIALCLIQASDPAKVNLELLGGEFAEPRELTIMVDRLPQDATSCTWAVTQVAAAGLDRTQHVGEFLLKDQQFSFCWQKDADKGKLPFCKLKITADADTEVCDLWSSVHPPALRVSFSKSNQKMAPFVAPGVKLPPVKLLQLELTFEGWPEHERSGDTLVLDETLEILFPEEDSDRNLLRTELTLKMEGGQLAIHASHSTNVPKPPSRSDKGEVKYEEKQLSHKELAEFTSDAAATAAEYQKALNAMEKELERSRTALDKLDRQLANGFAPAVANEREIRHRIDQIEEQKSVVSDLFDTFAEAETAMTNLSELCDEIETKGRVHFRLIRSTGVPDAEIVISSSVDAAANPAGRVP